MTVPNPSTIIVGQDITAALWNEQVRDALDFLLDPPQARLRHSTTQSLANGTNTALVWNTEDYDNYAGHSTSSNTSRYVAPEDGVYLCIASIPFASGSATGKREIFFKVNGTTDTHGSTHQMSATSTPQVTASGLIRLNVGDYVEVWGFQDSGGALNTRNDYHGGQRFDIRWMSA